MPEIFRWYTTTEFAIEMGKSVQTINRWVLSGFIVQLGHKLRRDETGHWYIGVQEQLHFPAKYTLSQSSHSS